MIDYEKLDYPRIQRPRVHSAEWILLKLHTGAFTTFELYCESSWPLSTIQNSVRKLRAEGKVGKGRDGKWHLVP